MYKPVINFPVCREMAFLLILTLRSQFSFLYNKSVLCKVNSIHYETLQKLRKFLNSILDYIEQVTETLTDQMLARINYFNSKEYNKPDGMEDIRWTQSLFK